MIFRPKWNSHEFLSFRIIINSRNNQKHETHPTSIMRYTNWSLIRRGRELIMYFYVALNSCRKKRRFHSHSNCIYLNVCVIFFLLFDHDKCAERSKRKIPFNKLDIWLVFFMLCVIGGSGKKANRAMWLPKSSDTIYRKHEGFITFATKIKFSPKTANDKSHTEQNHLSTFCRFLHFESNRRECRRYILSMILSRFLPIYRDTFVQRLLQLATTIIYLLILQMKHNNQQHKCHKT